MVLNESADFAAIADATVKRAFVGGKPEAKIRLERGTKLYKWTEHDLCDQGRVSPCWCLVHSRVLPGGGRVPGFREMEVRAKRLGTTHRNFSRVQSAVTKQWNEMSGLLLIETLADLYGFAGKALGQLEDEDVDKVYLIGGAYQVWVPGLTRLHVREIESLV